LGNAKQRFCGAIHSMARMQSFERILASFDGVITERNAERGDPGMNTASITASEEPDGPQQYGATGALWS
jgi:hypothetical protein